MDVTYDGRMQFTLHERDHAVTVDVPPALGGNDAGMSPVDLFAGAFGACVGYYALVYCRKHHLDAAGLRVRVEYTLAEHPKRVDLIRARLRIPATIGAEHYHGIKALAKACIIHATLHTPPETQILVEAG